MNLQLGLYISVKFRAFGITFGSMSRSVAVSIDVTSGKISFADGAAPGPLSTTLINERGVLVQAWI